jgi:sulfite exporter TauE/SafE
MWLRTYLNPPTRTAWGRWLGEYVTGVSLGFLPCGLVYGALAVSAGCGAPAMGAAAMAAFALGTAPALVAVGYGGALLGARRRAFLQSISKPVLMVNALTLFVIAVFSAFGQIR